MHGAQNQWHARNFPLHHNQKQEEHHPTDGVEEIQPNPEKSNDSQRN